MKNKSLEEQILEKGVTKQQVAKMVGINLSTLSRILSGKQSYVSQRVEDRINLYLSRINTDDPNIFNDNYKVLPQKQKTI